MRGTILDHTLAKRDRIAPQWCLPAMGRSLFSPPIIFHLFTLFNEIYSSLHRTPILEIPYPANSCTHWHAATDFSAGTLRSFLLPSYVTL